MPLWNPSVTESSRGGARAFYVGITLVGMLAMLTLPPRVYGQPVPTAAPAAPPAAPAPGTAPAAAAPPAVPQAGMAAGPDSPVADLEGFLPLAPGAYTYDPSGRRDPFASIVRDGPLPGTENVDLPPLQRLSLTELNLMGILWGGFGYSAMVQAPDGKGYTVRVGTKIGPNNGVVIAITENALTVEERFTDVYGKKQVREYVKRLHEKEGSQ